MTMDLIEIGINTRNWVVTSQAARTKATTQQIGNGQNVGRASWYILSAAGNVLMRNVPNIQNKLITTSYSGSRVRLISLHLEQ